VGLSRACLVTLSALVVEFGLGMWLNLYAQVPSADRHAGVTQQIKNGPLSLTVHAGVGAVLLVAALAVLITAVRARGAREIVLAVVGLGAIGGAAVAGELFVRDQQSKMSLAMAALTGLALLCYIYLQTLTSAARTAQANPRRDDPAEPAPHLPRRPGVPRPRPAATTGPTADWPDSRQGAPVRRYQSGYERPTRGQSRPPWEIETSAQPIYPTTTSGAQPAYPPTRPPRTRPGRNLPQQDWPANNRQPRRRDSDDFGYPEQG
jgi:hypothetical protein